MVMVLLVVLGFVIWAILAQKGGVLNLGGNNQNQNQSQTRESISGSVTVPNEGDKVPANVAPPVEVGSAGNNTVASYRSFDLNVSGGAFTPDTVIVKVGDTVHMLITASGGNYDFTQPDYGLKTALLSGKTTVVEFQAITSGKFTFYCASCGGPSKGPVGYVIVSP